MSIDALERNILFEPKHAELGPANASAAPHMLLEALGAAIYSQDQSAGDVQ